MLTRVAFQNFKALEAVTIDLERLTVLVGANATGKTSVLEGISALCELASARKDDTATSSPLLPRVFSGRRAPELLAGARDKPVSFRVTGPVSLQLDVQQTTAGEFDLSFGQRSWQLSVRRKDGTTVSVDLDSVRNDLPVYLASSRFPSATLANLGLQSLAAPSFVTGQAPRMDATGSGLATVIAELLVTRSPQLDAIQDDLRKIIPLARQIRAPSAMITRQENEILTVNGRELVNPVSRTYRGHRLEIEFADAGFLPIEALSEGTLLVLGVLTLLHTMPRPHVLLLDDIDRGLHPAAQRLVVESLRRFVDEHEDVQIICTSHSPYALDHFKPEEVRVMKSDSRGRAHCRKLTEHPDWNYWKDTMKPGEFWGSVGEGWVYEEDKDAT